MNVRFMEAVTVIAQDEGIATAMEFIKTGGYQVQTITYEDYGVRIFAVRERQPRVTSILPAVTFEEVQEIMQVDYRTEIANSYPFGGM